MRGTTRDLWEPGGPGPSQLNGERLAALWIRYKDYEAMQGLVDLPPEDRLTAKEHRRLNLQPLKLRKALSDGLGKDLTYGLAVLFPHDAP